MPSQFWCRDTGTYCPRDWPTEVASLTKRLPEILLEKRDSKKNVRLHPHHYDGPSEPYGFCRVYAQGAERYKRTPCSLLKHCIGFIRPVHLWDVTVGTY